MGGAEADMTTAMAPLGAEEALRGAGEARAIVEQLGRVVLGQEAAVRDAVAALIARGHVLLEGVPGTAKTLLVRALSQILEPGVPADSVHAGPHAFGHHRGEPAGRAGNLHLPPGPDLRRPRAGRRDQPRPGEDPGRIAGGDAGAAGHRGRRLPRAAGELHRLRHPESDRVRGHLPAARGRAGPVPGEGDRGLSRRAGGAGQSSTGC